VRTFPVVLAIAVLAAACTPSVLALDVGACFDDPPSFESVTDVPILDCSEPHDNEVIALEQMRATSYPGDESVASLSEDACVRVFDGAMGVPYLDSPYEVGWFSPSQDSWDVGDREIICFVFDPTLEKITGSVRGSTSV